MATSISKSNKSYRFGLFVTIFSSFFGRGIMILGGVILAKTLSPEILGKFAGDQALVFVGMGLVNLGIGQGYRQITSRNPELRSAYLLPSALVRFFTILLYLGAVVIYLSWVGRLNTQSIVVVFTALVFQLVELFQIDLQIIQSYFKVVVLSIAKSGILFLAAIICWAMRGDYNYFVFSYLCFTLVVVSLSYLLAKPVLTSIIHFDYVNLIKTSVPFAAAIIVYGFTSFWGLTYIREVLGEQQAGYYYISLKVYQIGLVMGMSTSATTLPLYHKLASAKEFGVFSTIFERLVRGMWLIAGLFIGICCFIPEVMIKLLATEEYLATAKIFPWIGFSIMFRLLGIPAGNILESVNKQWFRVVLETIGAVICMFGVILLVPRWGIMGAAWTLFTTNLWLLFGYWLVSRHFAPEIVALKKLFVPLSVLLITFFLVLICLERFMWMKLLVFGGIWFSYVLIVLNFKEEIVGILKSIFIKP